MNIVMGNEANKMLTIYQTCKTGSRLMVIGILFLFPMAFGEILLNDGFDYGGRTNGTDAQDVDWWKVNEGTAGNIALAIKTDDGTTGIGSGNALESTYGPTDGRYGILGDFDDGREIVLVNPGDSVTLKFDFRLLDDPIPSTVTDFRFGLMYNNGTRTTADTLDYGTSDDNTAYYLRLSTGSEETRATLNYDAGVGTPLGGADMTILWDSDGYSPFGVINDNL